jgi:hypothetical protein
VTPEEYIAECKAEARNCERRYGYFSGVDRMFSVWISFVVLINALASLMFACMALYGPQLIVIAAFGYFLKVLRVDVASETKRTRRFLEMRERLLNYAYEMEKML